LYCDVGTTIDRIVVTARLREWGVHAESMLVGVDEAGKGPVLGSMYVAAVGVDHEVASGDCLPDGLDDSKRLSSERRESLDEALRELPAVSVAVVDVPPARIDDPGTDMNTLTVAGHAAAIDALAAETESLASECDDVLVDAGDTSEARFGRRVSEHASVDVDVTAEHGADETHDVVAAASVVAKVARDAEMARLAESHGDVGSGYPSDSTTREFLADYVAEHDALPGFARASWATSRDVLDAAAQSSLGDF
jgi:ribonuclease HII